MTFVYEGLVRFDGVSDTGEFRGRLMRVTYRFNDEMMGNIDQAPPSEKIGFYSLNAIVVTVGGLAYGGSSGQIEVVANAPTTTMIAPSLGFDFYRVVARNLVGPSITNSSIAEG